MRKLTKFLLIAFFVAMPMRAELPQKQAASQTATFSMYCYWTGEATLGRIDGVLASRIGHWQGQEIVQVDFDPAKTDTVSLARTLQKQRSFYSVIATDSDGKRDLARHFDEGQIRVHSGEPHFIEAKHSLRTRYPELYALELSESQAIALNSWSYFGGSMPDVLSPEQKTQLR